MHLTLHTRLLPSSMAFTRNMGVCKEQAEAFGLLPILFGLLVITRVLEFEEITSDEL